jgi:hypothetical protein
MSLIYIVRVDTQMILAYMQNAHAMSENAL